MKANAPEKLYFNTGDIYGILDIYSSKDPNDNIEYVRKDTFIEKVYNYLKNYAFVDEDKKVHLPTLLHDFIKDSRKF